MGFILKAKGQTDLVVRYIRTIGGVSGRAIPALLLADEADIPRLCFDQATFEKSAEITVKPFSRSRLPISPVMKGAKPFTVEQTEEPAEWWPEAVGAGIFLVFGFGSAGVLTRCCRSSPRRKAGDRRAKGRRSSDDRRTREAEVEGDADKRAGKRWNGEKGQAPERIAKAGRRR